MFEIDVDVVIFVLFVVKSQISLVYFSAYLIFAV